MPETKTVVKIDPSSIRRNPRAGEITTVIPGLKWCDRHTTSRIAGSKMETREIHRSAGEVRIVGETAECDEWIEVWREATDLINPAARDFVDVKYELHRESQTIRHRPIAEWEFSYAPTPITCPKCGMTFQDSELESDCFSDGEGEETCVDNMCPKCGAECEVEYETIAHALAARKVHE